jgi:hypothetical protein
MDDVLLYFKNYSNTAQTLDLFSQGSSSVIINQYRFTTPYATTYNAGTIRFKMDGVDYATVYTTGTTTQQLADLLTAQGQGTWYVETSLADGTVYYVNSNTNVYTELEISATAGTTTIVSDNTVTLTTGYTFTGTNGAVISVDWGDGNIENIVLSNIAASYPHTYAVAGTYNIEISGQVDQITNLDGAGGTFTDLSFVGTYSLLTVISFTVNTITSVTLLPTMTTIDTLLLGSNLLTTIDLTGLVNLGYVDLSDNALTETAVDYILAFLDTNGLSAGQCYLDLGTNATPSAAGLTSKSNLEGKGWTVTVN